MYLLRPRSQNAAMLSFVTTADTVLHTMLVLEETSFASPTAAPCETQRWSLQPQITPEQQLWFPSVMELLQFYRNNQVHPASVSARLTKPYIESNIGPSTTGPVAAGSIKRVSSLADDFDTMPVDLASKIEFSAPASVVLTNRPSQDVDESYGGMASEYIHTTIGRAAAEAMVGADQPGTFLIRTSTTSPRLLTVTARSLEGVINLKIGGGVNGKGPFTLGMSHNVPRFDTITALLSWYGDHEVKVQGKSGTLLSNALMPVAGASAAVEMNGPLAPAAAAESGGRILDTSNDAVNGDEQEAYSKIGPASPSVKGGRPTSPFFGAGSVVDTAATNTPAVVETPLSKGHNDFPCPVCRVSNESPEALVKWYVFFDPSPPP